MMIRAIAIGAAALALSALPAGAQGRATQPIVLSKAVVRSMARSKSKTKTPLTARVGMIRNNTVAAPKTPPPPTSVRGLKPAAKKQ